ncbi:amino acid ABC transporter substrate-binding protein [Pontibaca methylaminivorans]|uniref:amino acid ABC transporter substrate-binding protein n=1 Tax=Pontibaca methylaminivorans TaxID=515897 RepID=UPI002FDB27ED
MGRSALMGAVFVALLVTNASAESTPGESDTSFVTGLLENGGLSEDADASETATLDRVRERAALNCGVVQGGTGETAPGIPGFAAPDTNGVWQGFDVALCRALAAAILDDPMAVNFIPTTAENRFGGLADGRIDLLVGTTSWSFARDVGDKFDFAGVTYYDGQGFMVPKERGFSSVRDLEGARICVRSGTADALALDDYFHLNDMDYDKVLAESSLDAQRKYLDGECEAYTGNASILAATRATFRNSPDHVLLPELISKEPRGPMIRHDGGEWGDLVRWTLYALIAAEEYGITSANIKEMAEGTDNPEINRLLGNTGDLGKMLDLDADWAVRAIKVNGNYGEIFAKNIGEETPVGLPRGLNAQWKDGGLLYAPPFR